MLEYLTLFSVGCRHNYYLREVSRDLQFVPTPDCKAVMKNYGLLFKSTGNGFVVMYQKQEGAEHLLTLIKEPLKFTFFVLNNNPLFLNFTDLPPARSGQ